MHGDIEKSNFINSNTSRSAAVLISVHSVCVFVSNLLMQLVIYLFSRIPSSTVSNYMLLTGVIFIRILFLSLKPILTNDAPTL